MSDADAILAILRVAHSVLPFLLHVLLELFLVDSVFLEERFEFLNRSQLFFYFFRGRRLK